MGRLLRFSAMLCVLLALPAGAWAAGWPWPLGSTVALRFGEPWTDANGTTCTHRGVDIAAPAGDEVRACADGMVAFCGPVPSSAGGRVLALTVQTPDGLKITYMPLEAARVSAGAGVRAGAAIGTLAAAGDGSSSATHLHLSVKRGDLSIDPEPLLALADAAPVVPPVTLSSPVQAAPAPAPLASAPGAAAPSPASAAVNVPETAPVAIRPPAARSVEPRAIHMLPSEGLRVPALSWRGPAVALPSPSAALRLSAGVVAALALWALAGRRAAPLPARVRR